MHMHDLVWKLRGKIIKLFYEVWHNNTHIFEHLLLLTVSIVLVLFDVVIPGYVLWDC